MRIILKSENLQKPNKASFSAVWNFYFERNFMSMIVLFLNISFLILFNGYVFMFNQSGHSGYSPFLTYFYLIPSLIFCLIQIAFRSSDKTDLFLFFAIILSIIGIFNVWAFDRFHIFQQYDRWIKEEKRYRK